MAELTLGVKKERRKKRVQLEKKTKKHSKHEWTTC